MMGALAVAFLAVVVLQDTTVVEAVVPPELQEQLEGLGLLGQVLVILIPAVAGWLTLQVMRGLKWLTTFVYEVAPNAITKLIKIDGFPATLQRALVLVVAAGLLWIGNVLGIKLPTELAQIGEQDVSGGIMAFFSMLAAMVFHAGDKAKTNGSGQ